ncbi:MAG: FAD-dependent oxidoreductase [Thermostichales cyanobacterium GMQP_bins_62]
MPQSLFTFTPSLPWVALGLTSLAAIQVDFLSRLTQQGIRFVAGEVTAWDPQARTLGVGEERLTYDYVIVATGADLDLGAVPGLGPEGGYTQSVCTPHHALLARQAWEEFVRRPGPLVVGAVPGASCFGPAYEFALLADFVLRKRGLRQQVPITLITPEPYAGHLGIGGMANAADLVGRLLQQRQIRVLENVAITEVTPTAVQLHSGEKIPFSYGMVLPPFRGAAFLRQTPGVADAKGFIPVLPTYQHPHFDSIYGVGVITELLPPEVTPLPVGVPKTGQMTEAMGMAVAHNIAVKLGALAGDPVTPTLEAICFADFGTTGIVFLADPVLPQPGLGRRRALAVQGRWVSWLKTAFEGYFLMKMRQGWAVPWFERWGLRMLGLSLVEPEGHG